MMVFGATTRKTSVWQIHNKPQTPSFKGDKLICYYRHPNYFPTMVDKTNVTLLLPPIPTFNADK